MVTRKTPTNKATATPAKFDMSVLDSLAAKQAAINEERAVVLQAALIEIASLIQESINNLYKIENIAGLVGIQELNLSELEGQVSSLSESFSWNSSSSYC